MTHTELTVLKALCDAYGTYAVVRQITDNAVKACAGDFADNQEAIIHKDTDILVDACNAMRNAHPIRKI